MITGDNIVGCVIGFFAFSTMSSFIYIINDIRDIEKDKLHPVKKERPLPSGKVKKSIAIAIAILAIIFSIIANILINKTLLSDSFYLLIAYMLINLGYSFGLKNVVLLDIILLATGFVIRVYYGASIIGVEVSSWLFLTISSAALFLGLGKRKKEFIISKDARKVLVEYNEEFLDKFQYLCLTLTIVFYSLWTVEQDSTYIKFSIPLLIVVFMKYCLTIEKDIEGDPTTILYKDKFLLILCVLYAILMLLFMVVIR